MDKITSEQPASQASFAETLVNAFYVAAYDLFSSDVPDASRRNAGRRMDIAKAALLQALSVPKQVEEDFPTLRDNFAMAAPALDFQRISFQPVMRARPEVPKRTGGTEFDAAVKCYADFEMDVYGWPEGKTEIKGWNQQVIILTPELKASVESYVSAAKVYEKDKAAWYQEHAEQTIAQWPWRYADLCLAARKAGT